MAYRQLYKNIFAFGLDGSNSAVNKRVLQKKNKFGQKKAG